MGSTEGLLSIESRRGQENTEKRLSTDYADISQIIFCFRSGFRSAVAMTSLVLGFTGRRGGLKTEDGGTANTQLPTQNREP